MRFWLFFLLLIAGSAAACAPNTADNPPAPTLTLIPATATDTPTPIPPTATPSNLLGPQDVSRATGTTTTPESLDSLSVQELIAQDPVAAELVGIAQRVVAADLDLPIRRIRLIDVRAVVWTDSALNCPLPDSEVVEQETDGYRIVLGAGEQEYLFHTDVDRVVPCDEANEDLQAGTLGEDAPTEEPTSEITPEAAES
ncbi:MAG: hypothetical protein ABI835_00155 [Chloroflexota bacterium]